MSVKQVTYRCYVLFSEKVMCIELNRLHKHLKQFPYVTNTRIRQIFVPYESYATTYIIAYLLSTVAI